MFAQAPLLTGVAAAVVGVVLVASCSSAAPKPSTSAGTPASTSSPVESTAPTPSVTSPATPSAASTTSPVSTGPSPTPKLKRVDVTTTFAGWNAISGAVEVGGYASVVEPPGTCTLRMIRGTTIVTSKHAATTDATTVACGGFSVPRKELVAGQWQAVLSYLSSRSTGVSAAVAVKVP